MPCRKQTLLATAILCCFTSLAGAEEAQVVVERANMRAAPSLESAVIVTLDQGEKLEVIEQSGQWYKVKVVATGKTGYIYQRLIELIEASPEPSAVRPSPQVDRPASRREQPTPRRRPPIAPSARTGATGPSPFGAQIFAQGSYLSFTASQSFQAILGSSSGTAFGGGVRLRYRRLFVEASLSRFEKTGERAFVFKDVTYPLGISNTITVTPMSLVAGMHIVRRDRYNVYAGLGFGKCGYKESSDFEDPSESVDSSHTSYSLLLGVEARLVPWVSVALDVQGVSVPDALGAGGVSAIYDETDLGYGALQLKVLIGR